MILINSVIQIKSDIYKNCYKYVISIPETKHRRFKVERFKIKSHAAKKRIIGKIAQSFLDKEYKALIK